MQEDSSAEMALGFNFETMRPRVPFSCVVTLFLLWTLLQQ